MNIDTVCLPGPVVDHVEGVDHLGPDLLDVPDGALPHHLASVQDGLGSDGASDADLGPPDHTELLADGHGEAVLLLRHDVLAGGADVGGEHHIRRHLGRVAGNKLELKSLRPLEERVPEVAVDAGVLLEVAEDVGDVIRPPDKGEDGAEVEVEPGKVGWLPNIGDCHIHQYLTVLAQF